jgi:hypothetical protein
VIALPGPIPAGDLQRIRALLRVAPDVQELRARATALERTEQARRTSGRTGRNSTPLGTLPALFALAIGGVFPTPIAALLALAICSVLAAPIAALRASTVRGVIPAPMIADRAAAFE